MKYALSVVIMVLFSALSLTAASIKGIVAEAGTGEPVVGAVVILSGGVQYHAVAGLDGSFLINGIAEGTYQIKTTYLGYAAFQKEVRVKVKDSLAINIGLVPDAGGVKQIEIVSHYNGNTDLGARQLEKKSDNELNILSQRTIELMPDVTVANVLRRVSGVTVDRGSDGGDGRYPVIRGMDKRYNYTLVNGIKIPSPDDKNRFVPMDVFPSEMLARLEVIKTLTPDMEGDAIGGAMNLVMKQAPESLVFNAQAALGYSELLFTEKFTSFDHNAAQMESPAQLHGGNCVASYQDFSKANLEFKKITPLPDDQFSFTLGNRFAQDKFGIMLSGSYQNFDRISKETRFSPNPQPLASPPNAAEFDDLEIRDYSTNQQRTGLNAMMDYRINAANTISLSMVYMNLNTYQVRYTIDTSLGNALQRTPGTGAVSLDYRSETKIQDIYNATLHGDHVINDHLNLDWSGAYSIATQQTPDVAEFQLSEVASINPASGKQEISDLAVAGLPVYWQHNSDQDLAGYVNGHYKFVLGESLFNLGAGGMYRHKDRLNYFNQYQRLIPTTGSPLDIDDAQFTFHTAQDALGTQDNDPNNYTTTEDIGAVYGEIKWQPSEKWDILGGERLESTYQSYNQYSLPASQPAKSGFVSYYDFLPSLNAKYNLNKKTSLRFSYFKSISRPAYFEIVPYFFPGEYFNEVGNYNLKHVTADNLDLRYELIPGSADQLLVGAFYKNIQNPIGYVYVSPVSSLHELEPQNLGTATNFGLELVYMKYFHRFGISANYTYTYSNVPTPKSIYYYKNSDTITTKSVIVNLPLQGQAAHIGNLSLLYKDPEKHLDIQVSGVYTGRHIVFTSPWVGLDYWQAATVVLDISAEKSISKHFSVYLKINNLLNTPDFVELDQYNPYAVNHAIPFQTDANQINVDKKYFGQSALVGFRYRL